MGAVLALMALTGALAGCERSVHLPASLRTTSCELAGEVIEGLQQSEAFRHVVERVGALKGIVYLNPAPTVQFDSGRRFDAALQHRIIAARDYRLLFVNVRPGLGKAGIALIGHELQHAVELLDAGAMTEREIDELFDRIGMHGPSRTTETAAALGVQRIIERELRSSRER